LAGYPIRRASVTRRHPKNKVKKLACFSAQKNSLQLTMKHHESTTDSPRKHHPKNTLFPKPPSKTPAKGQKKAPATAGTFFLQNLKN
jgi:hypothetical protein